MKLKEIIDKILNFFKGNVEEEKPEFEDLEYDLKPVTREYSKPKEPEIIHNYDLFPENVFKPERVVIDGDHYTLYKVRFNSLYSLYEYLKSEPTINQKVFRKLHSFTNDRAFAGKPYDEAVEDLISDYDPEYEEFLELQSHLDFGKNIPIHKYETIHTVAGGHLNIPAYSTGSPLCYETEQRIVKPRFIRIHIALSYYWGTSKKQVINRAIIITNVLKALEDAGYSVDINAFELSSVDDELVHIIVQLKNHGQKLNMIALYKSLCHVEFLRRILFRVLETLEVKNEYWQSGYGTTCDEDFARKALNFDENDIFFDQPRDMGIDGDDLGRDFESAIRHLGLESKINVEKAKEDFRQKVKNLKL